MPARPKPKAAILFKNEEAILLAIPREWWNYCTSPRLQRTISGEATHKTQGLHVSGLFSSVWDQNGELFVACSLDLRTFSLLFRSLSDLNALEAYFRCQLNPLAYNYIATAKKKPKLSRLSVSIPKPRCHSLAFESNSRTERLSLVLSYPFVVLLIDMLAR